ncbi:MAG: tetratricopeptide repeat protein [Myxococcota bacterium]
MASEPSAEELLDRGIRLLGAGHYADGLRNLRASYDLDPSSVQCLSYLGLAIALGEKNHREGEELCREAIRKQFYQSTFYYNLGQVYLASNEKAQAVRTFRKGLKVDPTNNAIKKVLNKVGTRGRPLLSFLSRDHVLNHSLGKIAARYFRRKRPGA